MRKSAIWQTRYPSATKKEKEITTVRWVRGVETQYNQDT